MFICNSTPHLPPTWSKIIFSYNGMQALDFCSTYKFRKVSAKFCLAQLWLKIKGMRNTQMLAFGLASDPSQDL